MTIAGFHPQEIMAKMADNLRVVLAGVSVTVDPPDAAVYAAAKAAADAALVTADAATAPELRRLAWLRVAQTGYIASAASIGTTAVAAKQWTVSSLYSAWDDFKKSVITSGEHFGGLLLITHQAMPMLENAPPSWDAPFRVRMRMGMPAQRVTGRPTDLAAAVYPGACQRAIVETITKNRRWGFNSVYASGVSDWTKVEDADPGMVTMDLTSLVKFTFTVTPVG